MNQKTQKALIWIGLVTGIGLLILVIHKWYKKRQKENQVKELVEVVSDIVTDIAKSEEVLTKETSNFSGEPSSPVPGIETAKKASISDRILDGTWDWKKSNDKFSLNLGSYGPNVEKLQKWLNETWDADVVPEHGMFDHQTRDMLFKTRKVDFVSSRDFKDLGL
jgi:hypothetical protein